MGPFLRGCRWKRATSVSSSNSPKMSCFRQQTPAGIKGRPLTARLPLSSGTGQDYVAATARHLLKAALPCRHSRQNDMMGRSNMA